jgi:hypothetical protein
MLSMHTYALSTVPARGNKLQVSPEEFLLAGGALSELLLVFRPATVGHKDIKARRAWF